MHAALFSRALPALAVVVVCSCGPSAPPVTAPAVMSAPALQIAPALKSAPVVAQAVAEPAAVGRATPQAAPSHVDEGRAGKSEAHALFDQARDSGGGALEAPLSGALGAISGESVQGVGGLGLRGVGRGGGGTGVSTMGVGAVGSGTGYGSGGSSMHVVTRSYGGVAMSNAEPAPIVGGTFAHAGVNPVVDTKEDRFSTFGMDVDSGSWMYARRFLRAGRPPIAASVRVEEFVNGMHYDYRGPDDGVFAIHVDAAPSPFTRDEKVVRVAVQGKRLTKDERKPASITFLVDVSGSMNEPDRLPWVRDGLHMAVDNLRSDDRVAIVTYAGETRLVLAATPATEKRAIHTAIETLLPGGGTNMGSGMELAYREANKELSSDRTSRVIVLSDGDANIGRTSHESIMSSIKGYVSEGVTMSTMGFGSGNYNDVMMEQLADAGNGNYTYIDSKATLKRFFVDEMTNMLELIAQDAKIQVEWNPDVVKTYRLLGYENRDIADKDFRNDKKDAGDVGAGHAVTALYEISLVDPTPTANLGVVRVRHKIPRHEHATEESVSIRASDLATSVDALDDDAKTALGMALAAEILRGSEHAAGLTLVDAAKLVRSGAHGNHAAERLEAADLFEKAPVHAVAAR